METWDTWMSIQAEVVFVTGSWGYNENMWHLGEHICRGCVCHRELWMLWKHVTLGWTYGLRLCLSQGAGHRSTCDTWVTIYAEIVFATRSWGYNGNMWRLSEFMGWSCVYHRRLGIAQHVTLGWTYMQTLCLSQGVGNIMETCDTRDNVWAEVVFVTGRLGI